MVRLLVALLFAGLSSFASAQTIPPSPPVLGKLVEVAGLHVHLYCTGQGSPTVVVASGGFSFDWGLIQPKIAQVTRVCTYDPAGTAWSDPNPASTTPNCAERVDELHQLLLTAGVSGPYVMVGFSIGGLVARLYAARHADEIAGVVFVDHAYIDTLHQPEPTPQPSSFHGLDSPPLLISQTPIELDLADDQNFTKLSARDQQLHRWAMTRSLRPTPQMAAFCFDEVEKAEKKGPFSLGSKPVAVVSTLYDSPRYTELQHKLLQLSANSTQFIAENSSHMVIIDEPEIVIRAIQQTIAKVKTFQ